MKLAFDLNLTSSEERARRWGSDLAWGSRDGQVCGDSPYYPLMTLVLSNLSFDNTFIVGSLEI